MDKDIVFDSVEDCIAEFAKGGIVIVADDENRENEGDMICAAEKITPEIVNKMLRFARGLICVPTTSERLTQLGIDDMVRLNRDAKGTAFTVTVDAARGITTGISAADRARTIALMGNAQACADDFVTPGHLNPLRARAGGVLERAGHTEAAVDLARLAGLFPCAAICESPTLLTNRTPSCSAQMPGTLCVPASPASGVNSGICARSDRLPVPPASRGLSACPQTRTPVPCGP